MLSALPISLLLLNFFTAIIISFIMFTFDHSNKYNADINKVNLNPKMLYLNPASFFRFQTNSFWTFIQQSFFHNFFSNNVS